MTYTRRPDGRYTLQRPVRVQAYKGRDGISVEAPAGFVFDVSVPRWATWLISPHDARFMQAAAVHDFALQELGWPRELAAAPFGIALRQAGVSRAKRLVMVLAVIIWRWR